MIKESNGKKATIYYSEDLDLDVKFIQDFVGGYFTGVNLQDGRTMLLNEEGMYKCELNEEAYKNVSIQYIWKYNYSWNYHRRLISLI